MATLFAHGQQLRNQTTASCVVRQGLKAPFTALGFENYPLPEACSLALIEHLLVSTDPIEHCCKQRDLFGIEAGTLHFRLQVIALVSPSLVGADYVTGSAECLSNIEQQGAFCIRALCLCLALTVCCQVPRAN